LLAEIKPLGYTGSLTHLQRLLHRWRQARFAAEAGALPLQTVIALESTATQGISPIVAAALCIKPRGLLTPQQAAKVDMLKTRCVDFTVMRHLAVRFRGILRSGKADKLDAWLQDAHRSAIHGMRQFVMTVRQDIAGVRNAVCEQWSNGRPDQFT
jgi:transposase